MAGPGQLLMRVEAAAICGTDLHIARGTMSTPVPVILGHELSGVVEEVGPGVTGWHVGERVTTETDASFCGRCAFCLAGDMHLCPHRTAVGTSSDGGLAEFVALPAGGVHRLPDGVGFAAGALSEPLAVAVRAVIERARVVPGEQVAVIGPGTIGLLIAQVALAQGADVFVLGLARHDARFRLARSLGVARMFALDVPEDMAALKVAGDGFGLQTVFEASGAETAFDQGLGLLRKGGRLIAVGLSGPKVELDLASLVQRELTIMASRGKRPTSFRLGLELLAEGRVALQPLITHRFPLASWEAGMAAAELPGSKVLFEVGAV